MAKTNVNEINRNVYDIKNKDEYDFKIEKGLSKMYRRIFAVKKKKKVTLITKSTFSFIASSAPSYTTSTVGLLMILSKITYSTFTALSASTTSDKAPHILAEFLPVTTRAFLPNFEKAPAFSAMQLSPSKTLVGI